MRKICAWRPRGPGDPTPATPTGPEREARRVGEGSEADREKTRREGETEEGTDQQLWAGYKRALRENDSAH